MYSGYQLISRVIKDFLKYLLLKRALFHTRVVERQNLIIYKPGGFKVFEISINFE